MADNRLYFDIVDTAHEPLHCKLVLSECGLADPGESAWVELQYYKKKPDLTPPYNQ